MKLLLVTTLLMMSAWQSRIQPISPDSVPDVCREGMISDGWGFNRHHAECSLFYQCYPGLGDKVLFKTMKCRFGLFWSQKKLACVIPPESECEDNCANKTDGTKRPMKGHCAGFWVCKDGKSVPSCCPMEMRYSHLISTCRRDGRKTCLHNEKCGEIKEERVCDSVPKPGSETEYIVATSGLKYTMPCPPGTVYRQDNCSCLATSVSILNTGCRPTFEIHFEKQDLFKTGIEITGVQIIAKGSPVDGGSYAYFDGSAYLNALSLANSHSTETKVVSFYMKSDGDVGRRQTIMTNKIGFRTGCSGTDCRGSMQIDISPNKELHHLLSTGRRSVQLSTIISYDWTKVWYIYDGKNYGKFLAISNQTEAFVDADGPINESQSGLIIGRPPSADVGDFYKGALDEFQVWNCIPKDAETLLKRSLEQSV
ncbi:hypothetical protein CHS0354_013215 [Potamilus streckersoni]|uniref:Chitin-binding type-2 domain-containing protein n=1 Tax=Potamilus streckersoni TaxID=2493646 RepID=A0AAE0W0E5_9BIVA|nr:hypothetical protein CHS0354_013215 [Potamilus streckersoni]